MAVRKILRIGDETLRRKARRVETIDKRIHTLLDDMAETMYEAEGAGLAAPQVGILRRIVVIDVGDGLHRTDQPGDPKSPGGRADQPGGVPLHPRPPLYREAPREGRGATRLTAMARHSS